MTVTYSTSNSTAHLETDIYNTYLRVLAEAVTDTSDNYITTSQLISASLVTLDTTAATLVEFTFDTNSGALNLTFSDVVLIETFNPNAITFQDDALATEGKSFTLTTYKTKSTDDHYVLSVVFGHL